MYSRTAPVEGTPIGGNKRVVASDGGLVQGEVGVTVQVRKIASRAGDGTCP